MAQTKVNNLCGASEEFNAMQDQFDDLISDALSSLEDEASTLASLLGDAFGLLLTDIRALMPELPDLPDINLQSLVTSLSSLTEGSSAYTTLLANIVDEFGADLTVLGFDLDTLIPDALAEILGGGDGCSVIPNMVKAADKLTSVYEKAQNSLFPLNLSVSEEASTLVRNAVLVAGRGDVLTRAGLINIAASSAVDVVDGTVTGEEPPTEDIGAFTVTDKTTGYAYGLGRNTIEVTTLADQDGASVTSGGFARRKTQFIERFFKDDVTQSGDIWTIKLSHSPIGIHKLKGNCLIYSLGPPIQKMLDIVPKGEEFEFYQMSIEEGLAYYEVDGKTIKIIGRGHDFTYHSDQYEKYYHEHLKDIQFQVSYDFFANYDPSFVNTK